MREKLPTIGLYILPQPDNTTEYVSIPNIKNSKVAPFGYKLNDRLYRRYFESSHNIVQCIQRSDCPFIILQFR